MTRSPSMPVCCASACSRPMTPIPRLRRLRASYWSQASASPSSSRVGTVAASRLARAATRISLQAIASAIRRRTVRRTGLRERSVPASARRRLWLSRRGGSVGRPWSPERPSALACVASPHLRRAPEGACAGWAGSSVARVGQPSLFRLGFPSGDDAFEILADGRRGGVTILGPARQQLPDHRRQARTCSGLPAMPAAAATGCAAPAGGCPAPGTADRRSPSRRAGRRPPRNRTVDRSRLNRAARATDRRCCRSRCASPFGSTTTPWRSRSRGP